MRVPESVSADVPASVTITTGVFPVDTITGVFPAVVSEPGVASAVAFTVVIRLAHTPVRLYIINIDTFKSKSFTDWTS